jgi:hypothetical protein
MHTSVLVPPSSIKSFEQHLRSTTALTPTQHGGSGLGSIVSIVAAVAIPWAAPVIASSIGISAALGPAIGSALVGAGLGAATAAATGQNIGIGALTGGVGGGIGGYMNTPSGIDPFTGNPIQSSVPFTGPAPGSAAFNAAPGMPTPVGVQSGIGGVAQDFGGVTNMPIRMTGPEQFLPSGAGAPPSLGSQLSGGTQFGVPETAFQGAVPENVFLNNPGADFPPVTDAGYTVGDPYPNVGNYSGPRLPSNTIDPSLRGTPFDTTPSVDTFLGDRRGGSLLERYQKLHGPDFRIPRPPTMDAQLGTQLAGVQPTPTFGDRLSGFLRNPIAGLKGLPDPVKKGMGDLLTQQAANFLASEPEITPGEQAALDQRARIMQMEEAEQARRRELGDQYMQQAQAINPVQLGMESAADAARRYERASRAGLRNLTGAQRTAGQRRAALDQARLGGSAFNQGFGRGLQQRMAAISQAANTGANVGSLYDMASADLKAANAARNRLNTERANAAGLISPLVAQGLFGVTDEERRKQQKRLG